MQQSTVFAEVGDGTLAVTAPVIAGHRWRVPATRPGDVLGRGWQSRVVSPLSRRCPGPEGWSRLQVRRGGVSVPIGDLRQDGAVPTGSDEIELSERELREIAGYAAECARGALPIFEQGLPTDTRPRAAIDAARAFAGGGRRTGDLRQRAWAAYRAAQEATSPAAVDAARAASHAAAAAYLHPKASAHQVKHILGAAAHAARAEELASGEDQRVTAGFLEWARHHAPTAVTAVLGRLPAAPAGGGRVGEFIRDLDAALRA